MTTLNPHYESMHAAAMSRPTTHSVCNGAEVENALPRLPPGLKEKILDAVYNTLCDNRADPVETIPEPPKCKHDGGFRFEDAGPFSDDIVYQICKLCNKDVLSE